MAHDGLDDEDWPESSPLLPPDDRLWRHPSELASTARPTATANREPRVLVIAVLAGIIGALLGSGVTAAVGRRDAPPQVAVEQIATPVSLLTGAGTVDVAAVADRTAPTLASVQVTRKMSVAHGSAVVWRSDGMLLTNQHLVAGATAITVSLADGRRLPADVVGADEDTDIALVRVDAAGLPSAALGSAAHLRVGQPAVVVGAPTPGRGSASATSGIVSGIATQVPRRSGLPLVDMIEIDAPMPEGASGGAAVDQTGAVIGVATAVPGDNGARMAYATPIDVARIVAARLLAGADVVDPWLGVDAHQVAGGVAVDQVWEDSPAEACGLRPGDVITALDGRRVDSMHALVITLRRRAPGDPVVVTYRRGGETRDSRTTLEPRPKRSRQRT